MSVILALLIVALLLGAYGSFGGTGWGYYGWSPLFGLILIAAILYALGILH